MWWPRTVSGAMKPAEKGAPGSVPTDAELARQISSSPPGGAREAEAELYRRLAPRIRLYGLRHLRDEQAAADLAHEALLLTIERLRGGEVREPARLASFVLGVCRMMVRDGVRRAGRKERLLEEYARTLPAAEGPQTSDLDRERLADCLGRLTERERSILVATFYVERTAEEIVRDFGLSAVNVRVIRHRALGRLRGCMEGRPS
jgi:RNA polymerase sigma-70 factor (ECF subfamily)